MILKLTIIFLSLLLAVKVNYGQPTTGSVSSRGRAADLFQEGKVIIAANGQKIGFFQTNTFDGYKHPLIIFLHGIGERGNGTTDLYKVATIGLPAITANSTLSTKDEIFIVLSPQLSTAYGNWQQWYVDEMLKYGKSLPNVDTSQIYLTGLSIGAGGCIDYVSQIGNSEKFAAMAVMAPQCYYTYSNLKNITLPVWAFVGDQDKNVPVTCTMQLQGQVKNLKLTVYPGGDHGASWQLGYKEPGLFEWMLNYSRTVIVKPDTVVVIPPVIVPPVPWIKDTLKLITKNKTYIWITEAGVIDSATGKLKDATFRSSTDSFKVAWEERNANVVSNILPTARAGNDTTITGTTATLRGKGFDSDGIIKSYKWSKIVKGSPTKGSISTSTKATTNVTGLVPGTYTFMLTVTDDHNYIAVDTVKITVKAPATIKKKVSLKKSSRHYYMNDYLGNSDPTKPMLFATTSSLQKPGYDSTYHMRGLDEAGKEKYRKGELFAVYSHGCGDTTWFEKFNLDGTIKMKK